MNWDMISFVFRALGFILIAVGVLLIVAIGQFPGSCYSTTSNCGQLSSSNISGMANAYIAGEVLMALGALLLGFGAGIKLHWVLKPPMDGSSEKMAWVIVELLTLSISAWICLVLAFIAVSSAVTLVICCCAVSLARLSAASARDRSATRVPFV